MSDDPRHLAEADIARLITALGEATSEEFAKTLESGTPISTAGASLRRNCPHRRRTPPPPSTACAWSFTLSRYDRHQFETVYGRYCAPEHSGESSELDDWAPPEDETPVTLAQVIPGKNARKISYVCNFHAMRRLGITLEEIAPAEPGTSYPRCTGGRRAAPSGDSHEIPAAGTVDDEPFSPTQVTAAMQAHLAGRMSPD